jgi:type IV pilus biogenesis/stability protein PilW
MSLIIDALKKAQQVRPKESESPPIINVSSPDKKRGRGSKRQWILIGAGLVSLCILLLILFKPVAPPLALQPIRTTLVMERRPSDPVTETIPPEPPRQVVTLTKDKEPLPTGSSAIGSGPQAGKAPIHAGAGQMGTEGLPHAKAAPGGTLSPPQGEKVIAELKPSLNKKREESQIKQAPLPVPPVAQKEEGPSKSIGVKQEGEKDRTLTADVLIQFNLGVQFYSQRDFSKAIQAYQKVIELDPTYVEAYNNLGIIYQMIGDVDRAFGAYQKSTEINPRYEKGYNNLGILLFLKGRYEEALGSFQKALAVNPNNIEAHINLGILFKKKGDSEKAIQSYQKALAINSFHKETHYNIALLYEQLENLELAINHYQQFIQLSSNSHPELVLQVKRHLYELAKTKNK